MNYLATLSGVIVLILFVAGCNSVGVVVDYASACNPENNKKYVEVSGILNDKGGLFCSNTSGRMECGFKLLQKAGDEKGFTADIAVGSVANTVEKPESGYKTADLKIRDNAGAMVKVGDHLRLTGTITAVKDATDPNGGVCYLKVDKIER